MTRLPRLLVLLVLAVTACGSPEPTPTLHLVPPAPSRLGLDPSRVVEQPLLPAEEMPP